MPAKKDPAAPSKKAIKAEEERNEGEMPSTAPAPLEEAVAEVKEEKPKKLSDSARIDRLEQAFLSSTGRDIEDI